MRYRWLVLLALWLASAPCVCAQATFGIPTVVEDQAESKEEKKEDPRSCGFNWTKSKYRYQSNFWTSGMASTPPTGKGHYSLLDWLHDETRDAAPKNGYPRVTSFPLGFIDANFNYVDDPKHQATFTERLHRIHVGEDWMFGTGGEYRNRFNYEANSRLTGRHNRFDLNRIRLFGELWYRDDLRLFAEFIDIQSTPQRLAPLQSDRNYGDLLNLFVDVKTLMLDDEAVYTRVGRQQLILGSQRVISTSDWGFTNRTFEGVRVFRRSEKFDANLFWLQPVIPKFNEFDHIDSRQHFAGVYTTYRPAKDQLLDTYWLYLSNRNSAAEARQTSVGALTHIAPYDVHTLGIRYGGKLDSGFLWETENMLQFGDARPGSTVAGNTTTGIGYSLKDAPLSPTMWVYYDYATGSRTFGGTNTYNQIFPLAHTYMGQMDYVGRSNIEDLNFHLYLYPTKWITVNMQYHLFHLARAGDALYNTSSVVSRVDSTGKAGRDVGSEFDIYTAFHVTQNVDVLAVYMHFFPGDFLKAAGPARNMDTVYLVFNVRW